MPNRPPLYRKAALEKRASPEQLDQLVSLTPIRAWVGLAAVASLVIAFVLWGFFGKLTLTFEQTGILTMQGSPQALTYVPMDQAQQLHEGMFARILPYDSDNAVTGQIVSVAPSLVTPEQATTVIGTQAFSSSPVFEVRIALDTAAFADNTPCSITITLREDRPISRVLPLFS